MPLIHDSTAGEIERANPRETRLCQCWGPTCDWDTSIDARGKGVHTSGRFKTMVYLQKEKPYLCNCLGYSLGVSI